MSPSVRRPPLNRHRRVRLAAVFYLVSRALGLIMLVIAPIAYWRFHLTDERAYGSAAGLVILVLLAAHLLARPMRCVACGQPVLRHTKQPKHAYAGKWLGFSTRARVAWDIATQSHHHCMYCHTRCRNAAPGSDGAHRPVRAFNYQASLAHPIPTIAEEAAPPSPQLGALVRPTIFDTALLSPEAAPLPFPPALSVGPERIAPMPRGQADRPEAHPPFYSAPPPLPSATLTPVPTSMEQANPVVAAKPMVPGILSPVAGESHPLPTSPFLPSVKPGFSELAAPFPPAPVMTHPVPQPSAFPFGNFPAGDPATAPAQSAAAHPMVGSPLNFGQGGPPAAAPAPGVPPTAASTTPSPFYPSAKPAAPIAASPFLSSFASAQGPAAAPVPAAVVAPIYATTALPRTPALPAAPPAVGAPAPFFSKPASEANLPVPWTAPHSAPPSTAPALPPAGVVAAAAGLSAESVVEILQQGRRTMESAFLAMIDQLRAVVPATPSPPTAPLPRQSVAAAAIPPGPAIPVSQTVPNESFADPAAFNPFAQFADETAPITVAPLTPAALPVPALFPPAAATGAVPGASPVYPPLHPLTSAPAPRPPTAPLPQNTAASFPMAFPGAPALPLPAPPVSSDHTAGVPARRRPLPAIDPSLLAELGPTLQQAFTPPTAPIPLIPAPPSGLGPAAFPSPFCPPGAAFPALPTGSAPAADPLPRPTPSNAASPATFTPPISSAGGFPLPPMTIPPGNSFAPTPGAAFAAPPAPAPPDSYPAAPVAAPAPFSFLQPVTPPPAPWPTDDPADLPSAADSPPMWTRTRTKSSLS